ncbi:MAG: DUF4215 domain-containing protein [Nannocystis sp.]|nr:DUF4215 domain-containing protein [Nannocystis sp.]
MAMKTLKEERRARRGRGRPWASWALMVWVVGCAGERGGQGAGGAVQGVCGDGAQEDGEECDDGNGSNEDGCLNTCVVGVCGDGHVQVGVEACDDGNAVGGDGCDAECREEGEGEVECGNGAVEEGEECDDGNEEEGDGCRNSCELARCGDGVVWKGEEECDDGNGEDGDGCLNTRAAGEVRGRGGARGRGGVRRRERGGGDGCRNSCELARCGDGVVWKGEEGCDDGNEEETDACLNTRSGRGAGTVWCGRGWRCAMGEKAVERAAAARSVSMR